MPTPFPIPLQSTRGTLCRDVAALPEQQGLYEVCCHVAFDRHVAHGQLAPGENELAVT